MITLLKDGILACGTIRKDRKCLPKNQGKKKDMKKGDSEYRTSYGGIRWLKWVDEKPFQFLSNFHDPSALSEVERTKRWFTKDYSLPSNGEGLSLYGMC